MLPIPIYYIIPKQQIPILLLTTDISQLTLLCPKTWNCSKRISDGSRPVQFIVYLKYNNLCNIKLPGEGFLCPFAQTTIKHQTKTKRILFKEILILFVEKTGDFPIFQFGFVTVFDSFTRNAYSSTSTIHSVWLDHACTLKTPSFSFPPEITNSSKGCFPFFPDKIRKI